MSFDRESKWMFLSSHAQVFLCIGLDPNLRMREVAEHLGLTERAVQRHVRDLETEGYLTRIRVGRRNRYEILHEQPMRHPLVRHNQVRVLLSMIDGKWNPNDIPAAPHD